MTRAMRGLPGEEADGASDFPQAPRNRIRAAAAGTQSARLKRRKQEGEFMEFWVRTKGWSSSRLYALKARSGPGVPS